MHAILTRRRYHTGALARMLRRVARNGTFEVDLGAGAELRHARDSALAVGGLLVRGGAAPALFTRVRLSVRVGGGEPHHLAGQVVNEAPGGGFFVHLDAGAPLDILRGAVDAALEAPEPEPEPEPADDGAERREGPQQGVMTPVWELVDSTSDEPLYKQISRLSVNDRIRLARQANLPVRRILVRDIEKRVHDALIKSPKLSDEEIKEYSAIASLSPLALRWIASQPKLARRRDVMMNVATNPACPQDSAFKILDRMSDRELMRVLRSPRAREAIKRQCKRKLMKAGVI